MYVSDVATLQIAVGVPAKMGRVVVECLVMVSEELHVWCDTTVVDSQLAAFVVFFHSTAVENAERPQSSTSSPYA